MVSRLLGCLIMSNAVFVVVQAKDRQRTPRFPACQTLSDQSNVERNLTNALQLIRASYPQQYYNSRISHHLFVRMAPTELQTELSKLLWTKELLHVMKAHFPPRTRYIADVYDEIYLMRPEFDFVDEQKAHYDGILNLPGVYTLRSLTYLEGEPATLVAASSQRNFTTNVGSTIMLDFNRELHFAVLSSSNFTGFTTNSIATRVMIKATIHVMTPDMPMTVIWLHILAHRLVFFGIKSVRIAFESSESKILLALDNLMRCLNKIHMVFPVTLIGVPLVVVLVAPFQFPLQFFWYLLYIVWVCCVTVSPAKQMMALSVAAAVGFAQAAITKSILRPKIILLHFAWFGICQYMNNNTAMARHILFAPIPPLMELDESFSLS